MNKPISSNKKTKKHFTIATTTAYMLFIGCVVALWYFLGSYSSEDVAAYQKLMQTQNEPLQSSSYTSRQHRTHVQKDVFFAENEQLLNLRLLSAGTQLALDHRDHQTEIVEHMHDVVCYIQEELFYRLPDGREAKLQQDGRLLIKSTDPKKQESWLEYNQAHAIPMQIIRKVEANTATYYYKNSQFLAENVKVTRYIASGHSIEQATQSSKSLMGGLASWVEFSLAGKGINFKAYQLKAKFYAGEKDL